MTADKLHGSWKLVRAYKTVDGRETDSYPLGRNPYGYIHYLPDGRVSVIIAHDGRVPLTGGRWTSSDAELAASARTMDAYAGTFAVVAADKVVHYLDISSYENDRGTEYPRSMAFADGNLILGTPEVPGDEGLVGMKLVWARVAG
ncbi:MAG: lipocalin-like domain-containing protein [Novosphingobium sp.]|nr:lipocalin-like domain-containing protein [Novosphingobium sp.]